MLHKNSAFLFIAMLLLVLACFSACSGEPDITFESSADFSSAPANSNPSILPGASSPQNTSSGSVVSVDPNALIYISEYVEGLGTNKYIELYNPRNTAFSLSGWSLRQYNNGDTKPTALPVNAYIYDLSGTIPARSTYVIRHSQANGWTGTANLTINVTVMQYNGNDAMGLFNGDTLVDIVGVPGNSANIIKDMTLVRRPNKGPAVIFNFNDWYQLVADTLDYLGSHDPINGIKEPSSSSAPALPITYPKGTAGSDLYISEYFCGANNDKYIEIYNNTGGTVNLSAYRLLRIDADNITGATNAENSYCMQLSGNLPRGNVFVVINAGYNPARLPTIHALSTVGTTSRKFVEPPTYPRGICFFGGNDPVYLIKDGLTIDAIGKTASADVWGEDKVWVRGGGTFGKPVWDDDDWLDDDLALDPYDSNKYANDGDHWGGWHDPTW
jgi:hypothetical protein